MFAVFACIGVDLGGIPPIIELGKRYHFGPQKSRRKFSKILKLHQKKYKELNYCLKYHNENSYFNYLHPKNFKNLLRAKLSCTDLCTQVLHNQTFSIFPSF